MSSSSSHTTSISLTMAGADLNTSMSEAYYTIVVGGQSFKLTWLSLSSDGPNYFTNVFTSRLEESLTKMMYIDRDPEIFKDIVKHLQGYYVMPRDEVHFTDLYVDAIFYSLTKLKAQLQTKCIVNLGGKVFRIEQEVLKRDSPNFFTTMGFGFRWEPPPNIQIQHASIPPPMLDRDPDLFADILRYLQGYEVRIRDEVHRQNLLKDGRFYHLRGLTEKLLESRAIVNGFAKDQSGKNDILFLLKDIRTSCVILPEGSDPSDVNNNVNSIPVLYKSRTKEGAIYDLLVEIHDINLFCRYQVNTNTNNNTITNNNTNINFASTTQMNLGLLSPPRTTQTIVKFELVFTEKDVQKLENIAKSIKIPHQKVSTTTRSPESCAFEIDGIKSTSEALSNIERLAYLLKSDPESGTKYLKLYVTKCMTRLFVRGGKMEIELVKCEAFSSERGFNSKRDFLPVETKIVSS
ncbi:7115_t:CDS:2 [Ambispora gerdemannii]|uniref:7115_t:CDS:1 n=1 Tax=Ambispora gerdemannii TaxID=144530 RepID=A0A9N8ZIL6_9GLOM|nr:7115_t:CDS:2 [Ambispora gerdemannii]